MYQNQLFNLNKHTIKIKLFHYNKMKSNNNLKIIIYNKDFKN